ncbi:MAG: TonB-dependent receptor, partial [Candidatus Korobacteraceae bacterium]
SGYSAEYGNTGGGEERYAQKSGTNSLHGSAYEFLRNEAFDARGWFDSVKPTRREHEFGGTIGGPVYLPKLYNGRNRSFFFFSFNGYTTRGASSTNITSVPTAAFRNGDFSSLISPSLAPADRRVIYDPATTRANPANPAQFIRDPFPGNIIPANRLDATARGIIALYPLPNRPGDFNNYAGIVGGSENQRWTYTFKVDHQLTDTHRLTVSNVATINPSKGANAGMPDPISPRSQNKFTYWFPRATWDWSVTPTVLNQFRLSFNRQTQYQDSPMRSGNWPAQLGLRNMEDAVGGFPRVLLPGFFESGVGNGFNDRFSNTYTISDALSWTKGAHNLKFGFEGRRLQTLKYLGNWAVLGFSSNETAAPQTAQTRAGSGSSFASFILGQVDNSILPLYGNFAPHFNTYQIGMYVQDDFKITPRLTLNLGMRYDMYTPTAEAHNWYAMVDTTKPNPFAGNLPGAYSFAGLDGNGNRLSPADHNVHNFAPRLGLAYKLNDKTVIRSGYGISYFQAGAYGGGGPNTALNDGYWIDNAVASLNTGVTAAFTLANGYPAANKIIPPNTTARLGVGTGLVNYWHPNADRTPYMQNWNLNIQRQLTGNLSLDIGYVGSKGTSLSQRSDINQLDPKYITDPVIGPLLNTNINNQTVVARPYPTFTGTVGQALRPFPQFVGMVPGGRSSDNDGNSNYHSLQVQLQKRFSHGLNASVSYTHAKSLTDAAYNFVNNATVHRSIYNSFLNKAVSPLVRPDVLAVGFNYELPFGPGKALANSGGILGRVIGGWQMNGVLRYQTGAPLGVSATQANPTYSSVTTTSGGVAAGIPQTADRVAGTPLKLEYDNFNPRTDRYLNLNAFTLPTGVFGNTPQFISDLNGPMSIQEDMSLIKKTRISEGVSLDLRFEAFNVFNRVVWGNPNTNRNQAQTFGFITSAGSPRNGQIAAKITF